jgi:hypothetical protein
MFLPFVFMSNSLRRARYTSYLAISWPRIIEPRSEIKTELTTPKLATLGLKEEFCFKNCLVSFLCVQVFHI